MLSSPSKVARFIVSTTLLGQMSTLSKPRLQ